ncbi:MAG TPA: hypothetical protein VLK22_02690 [Candidatus Udaeobacter sp.]|nr:hypothetical protein [Candidatus Udaeobacter sp.]
MPEGSAARKLDTISQQEAGDSLAADKAWSAVDFSKSGVNDNVQPSTQEPEKETDAPPEDESSFNQNEQTSPQNDYSQGQLDDQQQFEAAANLSNDKQRQLRQIQMERKALQTELEELEKDLTDFKNSRVMGFFSIFQPRINQLIDSLINQLKKQARNLADEAKVNFLTAILVTVNSLIGTLTGLKFFAAFLDALFISQVSAVKLIAKTLETIIIPIILLLIMPIYVPFLTVLFMMGKFPLLKGKLTQNLIKLIEKLKKQRAVWDAELAKAKRKVNLKKQLKSLNKFEKQVKKWR